MRTRACPGSRLSECTVGDRSPARRLAFRYVIDVGTKMRNQPAPPRVVFEALAEPERAGGRAWLNLLEDEVQPRLVQRASPGSVVWSSIWPKRSDAVIRFDLAPGGSGTDLRWTLSVQEPIPGDADIGHMCKRIQQLINADLRFSFGQ